MYTSGQQEHTLQDAQKGLTSHPPNPGSPRLAVPQARPQFFGCLSLYVSRFTFHGSSERGENAAGRLFQHPARNFRIS
jgi:hypothetical protein